MNPYDILGVNKSSSDDEIKKAFRKAAHKYHPDKEGGDENKFKEINEAYQILSNKEKRAQYDQFGQTFNGASGGPGGGGGFDFSQFKQQAQNGSFEFNFGGGGGGFSDIFEDMYGKKSSRTRGRDIQVRTKITFKEMIEGITKKIELYKSTTCNGCSGTGGDKNSKETTCEKCKGSGSVQKVMRTMLGNFAQTVTCNDCEGRGKRYEKQCADCKGKGKKDEDVIESVEIPAGINNGQTILVNGRGEAGENGGPAGDLLIVVEVINDSKFIREEDNINSEVHISFSQAALGSKVDVETVDDSVTMKIPSGTQSGEIFRIRNKGVPRLQRMGRGDHMVTVVVDVPTKLSRSQKKLIEELTKEGL